MSAVRTIANLLLAHNSATTLRGSSTALSPSSDRKRFHALRAQARALVIGGNTYRNEPYAAPPLPLYVASRSLPESISSSLSIFNEAPHQIIRRALADHGEPVLIEGGPTFVTPLIEKQQIDALYVTRVLLQGDGDFFDETILKHGYRLVDESVHEENSNPVAFQIWKPKL